MAGIRSFSIFQRSPAWPTNQLGLPKGAYPRPCTCQLSQFPKPMPESPTSTDLSLESSNLINVVSLPRAADRKYSARTLEELVESIQTVLRRSSDPAHTLNLIDTVQRLGISHHFEEEIDEQLDRSCDWNVGEDLFVTALRFRLLRQAGKHSSSDVFQKFISKEGKLKDFLAEDRRGMLSLHEASYLATKNEEILLHAQKLTRTSLQQLMPLMSSNCSSYVAQALKLPRHLRMARLESRNYISCYRKEKNFNLDLFQLARVDFNMVQQLHNTELTEIVRWWKQLGLVDKLSFARDRPLECFLWTVGIFPEPYHSSCRIELTKTIAILLVLDDVFDSYGSLDDLVLFTDAIRRWDLGAMEHLPEYMKICYMALFNTTNNIGYRILKKQGWNVVPHLKRTDVTNETAAMMEPYPNLFSVSGKILRLWDDLGTAEEEQERGDVASSIQCYTNEKGFSSEKEAREHIRNLISSSWLELNGELVSPTAALPLSIVKASLNLGRTAQVVYEHGDDENASCVAENGAYSRTCTCQLSQSPKPMPESPTSTDPSLESGNLINVVSLPRAADRKYSARTLEELVESIQTVLRRSSDPASTLNLIDTVQRLGISHHFEEEIDEQLDRSCDWNVGEDLFVTALRFRLLRQAGKHSSSDVFQKFISKEGKLKDFLAEDRRGMLSLHEASYLATKNEEILLQAQKLTRTSLQQLMPLMSSNCSSYVAQALKLPRHLRMARLESRNYISCYRQEKNFNCDSFQLARVDFNMVQQLHNTELTEIVRWWKQLGLVDKLSFARDRPLECFLWTVGIFPEPYHSSCRIELTKTIAILLVLDDVFDSYGSLDDLWIDIVEAFLVEAKWFSKIYVPSPEEYLANGVTTGGTYMALVHAFFLMGQDVTNETAAMMEPYPNLFSEEQERGDVASSIQCYTNEKGFSSEKEAREHIRNLISSSWLELNGELVSPTAALPLSIVKASLNLGRTAQVVYELWDDENASCC
uniref:Terpene synthase N-terminal domain-containing protein n=1 Tax=Salix viminalis TaxID=40686 RepID=A0A6N2MAL9_SALVM